MDIKICHENHQKKYKCLKQAKITNHVDRHKNITLFFSTSINCRKMKKEPRLIQVLHIYLFTNEDFCDQPA